VLVAVEVEDAGDEVPVQHGIAGSEQSFEGFAIDLQLGEPRVVAPKRDQLIGYVTVRGQPDPILEPTGDSAGFVDDRYVRVGVDHPPEERRTRPVTAHDKDVGVSVEPVYRLHCSHSRSGCFFTTYVPPPARMASSVQSTPSKEPSKCSWIDRLIWANIIATCCKNA
jgi:hypothetical protein